jgi:hypothetical protein
LQAGRKVWRLADNAALLRIARSEQIADHHHPCCNPNTGLQRNARLQGNHRGDEFQSRPNRALRIVLMRLRVAKVY